MVEYVKLALSRYAEFGGRSRRSEYWYWTLAVFLLNIVVTAIDTALGIQVLGILVALALFVPGLAVTFRRLHDTGRSAWWLLIGLIPLVGFIVLIVFLASDSDPAPNAYGPSPKYGAGGYSGVGYQPPPGQDWGQAPGQPQWGQPTAPPPQQWNEQPGAGQQPQWGQPSPAPQPQWNDQSGTAPQPQWGQPSSAPQQPQWGQGDYPPPPSN